MNIKAELAAMERLPTNELAERYAELRGQPVRTRHRAHLIRKIAWRLQADAEGDLTVKKAISPQVGEHEAEGERFQEAVPDLAERGNDSAERLAGAVRQAPAEARESFDAAASHAQLREAVERWVGPMILRPDGTIAQKESAAEPAADVKGSIAGARLYRFHIKVAFWQRFTSAA